MAGMNTVIVHRVVKSAADIKHDLVCALAASADLGSAQLSLSKETTKPSESKTPADMSPQAGPPAALPDAGARPRPPLDMFVGPGFSEAVGMGRSRRDIKSPERFRSAVTLERPTKAEHYPDLDTVDDVWDYVEGLYEEGVKRGIYPKEQP